MNPRQPESQSLRNFDAYIQLRLEGGKSYYLFNLSYTWVTQLIDNSILFKFIAYFNIKKVYNINQIQDVIDRYRWSLNQKTGLMKHKFFNIRGTKYANLDQLDIAISYYEKAIDLNPDFTGTQNNLSNAKALK